MAETCNPHDQDGIFVLPEADISGIKRKYLDIVYSTVSPFQKLDIYLPPAGDGPFPVVMAVHGGAWMMCDKRDLQLTPMLHSLQHGYAVVSINYRLSSEARFPAQIRDVKAAIRLVKQHGMEYALDADRIALWGGSAGAHLSLLAGLTSYPESSSCQCNAVLDDPAAAALPHPGPVKAIVSWYGPTDFLAMDGYLAESGLGPCNHGAADSPESRLLGVKTSEVPSLVQMANPETYISHRAPPLFIQHGLRDSTVPYQHSVKLARLASKAIGAGKVYLELFEHAEHADPAFETADNLVKIMGFLDHYVK
jgi:acetyl esterase/lipase